MPSYIQLILDKISPPSRILAIRMALHIWIPRTGFHIVALMEREFNLRLCVLRFAEVSRLINRSSFNFLLTTNTKDS